MSTRTLPTTPDLTASCASPVRRSGNRRRGSPAASPTPSAPAATAAATSATARSLSAGGPAPPRELVRGLPDRPRAAGDEYGASFEGAGTEPVRGVAAGQQAGVRGHRPQPEARTKLERGAGRQRNGLTRRQHHVLRGR